MRRFVTRGKDGDADVVARLPLGHTLITRERIFKHVGDPVRSVFTRALVFVCVCVCVCVCLSVCLCVFVCLCDPDFPVD
jgi:hypothetical protein